MQGAVDEECVRHQAQLIAEDNSRDKSEPPVTYSNGETMRQILARSKAHPDDANRTNGLTHSVIAPTSCSNTIQY